MSWNWRLKTLIIEDDEEVAAHVASGLRERGHDAAIVANGRDGVQRATAEHFDVIILDRMLPENPRFSRCLGDEIVGRVHAGAVSNHSRVLTTASMESTRAGTITLSSRSRSKN